MLVSFTNLLSLLFFYPCIVGIPWYFETTSMEKIVYKNIFPEGTLKLYHFIMIVTTMLSVLSQLPSFHSLRHINLASLLLCLGYTFLVVAGCIRAGIFKTES